MLKKHLFLPVIIALTVAFTPSALALSMPKSGAELAEIMGVAAQSYIVEDLSTGQVLISKNADLIWPPASLTKLVTILVFLDTKPKLTKSVAMTAADQTVGGCKIGGACIATKAGVKYKLQDLLAASLIASANNAANAIARSTGLTPQQFAAKMNEKAVQLGALNTHFNEPTGMDPANYTTAADFAKIVKVVFDNPQISKMARVEKYSFASTNNSRYKHNLKSTDKLLGDKDFTVLGGKTGFLDESLYNFGTLLQDKSGQKFAVVVLGSRSYSTQFSETKLLATLAEPARAILAMTNLTSVVLGTSTEGSIK